jgi:hypothetical protein
MDDQRTGNIYTVYIQRCLQLMVQKQITSTYYTYLDGFEEDQAIVKDVLFVQNQGI